MKCEVKYKKPILAIYLKGWMNQYGEVIADQIAGRGVAVKAEWWNRYLKGEITFVGTSIPEIRKLLLEMNRKVGFASLAMNRQVGIVNGLVRSDLAEHKLAAILYIQLFWLGRKKDVFLLNMISDWYTDRHIHDWKTNDCIAIKLLAPMIDSGEEEVLWILKRWNRDPYLWKARASLLPFAHIENISEHKKNIERFSSILIRREERFAKTAVGSVMRKYSRVDEAFVLGFLSKHVKHTTWDVKRNALKFYRQKLKES